MTRNPTLSDAVRALSDDELAALAEATYVEPSPCPALMAWLEQVVDAERHRRIGVELPLMTREDAIDDTENVTALAVAVAMRDNFADSAVRGFLSAIVAALSSDGTAH